MKASRRAGSQVHWQGHGRVMAGSWQGSSVTTHRERGTYRVLTGRPYGTWTSGRLPTHDSGSPSFQVESTGSCPVGHTASLKPKAVPLSAQPLPPSPSLPSSLHHNINTLIHICSIRAQRRLARPPLLIPRCFIATSYLSTSFHPIFRAFQESSTLYCPF